MRDLKRIPRIMKKLHQVWARYPDLRFYQLVENIQNELDWPMFYIEDDEFEELIDKCLENVRNEH